MMSKAEWDALTDQERWDHYCLALSECAELDDDVDSIPDGALVAVWIAE